MHTSFRVPQETTAAFADLGIHRHFPIETAAWITHPAATLATDSFADYRLEFVLPVEATFRLHVSADQRFELFCDGEFVGMGPDRSTPDRWSFHVYELTLPAGAHTLLTEVHFIAQHHPAAQTFVRPAFILQGERSPVDLATGTAPWQTRLRDGVGVSLHNIPNYHVVGPQYTLDAAAYFRPDVPWVTPVIVAGGCNHNDFGGIYGAWRFYPSRLPEQLRRPAGGGRIRMVADQAAEAPLQETPATANVAWQQLIDGQGGLVVPANTRIVVLWDLEQYHTAYPEITLSGGAGARVNWQWAESCFEPALDATGQFDNRKGDRNAISGKRWLGFGDTFLPEGAATRTFRPCWWRAGRYIRLLVDTASEPLTLERLRLLETRLPLENASAFECDDAALQTIIPVAVRGIQMCAHETYMDCPYYEQMMYVGDTRLQMLTAYVMSTEDRLNRRGLELFDWSRRLNGLVLARHPSWPSQLISPFSMIWILMVRDFAWWRTAPEFVRARLTGVRSMLEEFKALQGDRALLTGLPGWPFMDWVPGWTNGNAPDGAGTSGSINLLFLNALVAAAELETAFGEPHLAAANRAWAGRLAAAIRTQFWDAERGLFADDLAHAQWSEHAQCLALLSGQFPVDEALCFERLLTAPDLARTTVYFSFYLLETLARFGRGDLMVAKMAFWKEMVAQGFRTPVESPEPSRSDCHAWGSHPLFHFHASLAGIRPDAPGFGRVRISPQPGPLQHLGSTMPHPAGTIAFDLARQSSGWRAVVRLPDGVPGILVWRGQEYPVAGTATLALPE